MTLHRMSTQQQSSLLTFGAWFWMSCLSLFKAIREWRGRWDHYCIGWYITWHCTNIVCVYKGTKCILLSSLGLWCVVCGLSFHCTALCREKDAHWWSFTECQLNSNHRYWHLVRLFNVVLLSARRLWNGGADGIISVLAGISHGIAQTVCCVQSVYCCPL